MLSGTVTDIGSVSTSASPKHTPSSLLSESGPLQVSSGSQTQLAAPPLHPSTTATTTTTTTITTITTTGSASQSQSQSQSHSQSILSPVDSSTPGSAGSGSTSTGSSVRSLASLPSTSCGSISSSSSVSAATSGSDLDLDGDRERDQDSSHNRRSLVSPLSRLNDRSRLKVNPRLVEPSSITAALAASMATLSSLVASVSTSTSTATSTASSPSADMSSPDAINSSSGVAETAKVKMESNANEVPNGDSGQVTQVTQVWPLIEMNPMPLTTAISVVTSSSNSSNSTSSNTSAGMMSAMTGASSTGVLSSVSESAETFDVDGALLRIESAFNSCLRYATSLLAPSVAASLVSSRLSAFTPPNGASSQGGPSSNGRGSNSLVTMAGVAGLAGLTSPTHDTHTHSPTNPASSSTTMQTSDSHAHSHSLTLSNSLGASSVEQAQRISSAASGDLDDLEDDVEVDADADVEVVDAEDESDTEIDMIEDSDGGSERADGERNDQNLDHPDDPNQTDHQQHHPLRRLKRKLSTDANSSASSSPTTVPIAVPPSLPPQAPSTRPHLSSISGESSSANAATSDTPTSIPSAPVLVSSSSAIPLLPSPPPSSISPRGALSSNSFVELMSVLAQELTSWNRSRGRFSTTTRNTFDAASIAGLTLMPTPTHIPQLSHIANVSRVSSASGPIRLATEPLPSVSGMKQPDLNAPTALSGFGIGMTQLSSSSSSAFISPSTLAHSHSISPTSSQLMSGSLSIPSAASTGTVMMDSTMASSGFTNVTSNHAGVGALSNPIAIRLSKDSAQLISTLAALGQQQPLPPSQQLSQPQQQAPNPFNTQSQSIPSVKIEPDVKPSPSIANNFMHLFSQLQSAAPSGTLGGTLSMTHSPGASSLQNFPSFQQLTQPSFLPAAAAPSADPSTSSSANAAVAAPLSSAPVAPSSSPQPPSSGPPSVVAESATSTGTGGSSSSSITALAAPLSSSSAASGGLPDVSRPGEAVAGTSSSSRRRNRSRNPSLLLASSSKKPFRTIHLRIPKQYTMSKKEIAELTSAATCAAGAAGISPHAVQARVSVELEQLKDLVRNFGTNEKARVRMLARRPDGTDYTIIVSVLTVEGVKRLLATSRANIAAQACKFLMEQVDLVCSQGLKDLPEHQVTTIVPTHISSEILPSPSASSSVSSSVAVGSATGPGASNVALTRNLSLGTPSNRGLAGPAMNPTPQLLNPMQSTHSSMGSTVSTSSGSMVQQPKPMLPSSVTSPFPYYSNPLQQQQQQNQSQLQQLAAGLAGAASSGVSSTSGSSQQQVQTQGQQQTQPSPYSQLVSLTPAQLTQLNQLNYSQLNSLNQLTQLSQFSQIARAMGPNGLGSLAMNSNLSGLTGSGAGLPGIGMGLPGSASQTHAGLQSLAALNSLGLNVGGGTHAHNVNVNMNSGLNVNVNVPSLQVPTPLNPTTVLPSNSLMLPLGNVPSHPQFPNTISNANNTSFSNPFLKPF